MSPARVCTRPPSAPTASTSPCQPRSRAVSNLPRLCDIVQQLLRRALRSRSLFASLANHRRPWEREADSRLPICITRRTRGARSLGSCSMARPLRAMIGQPSPSTKTLWEVLNGQIRPGLDHFAAQNGPGHGDLQDIARLPVVMIVGTCRHEFWDSGQLSARVLAIPCSLGSARVLPSGCAEACIPGGVRTELVNTVSPRPSWLNIDLR
ncbi:hypothetical protein C8Q77DRAFT_909738 [Trametes polyzona]|nr:hypothetical protein C8Q77DRAFT_909738 [Trametes polyzona]